MPEASGNDEEACSFVIYRSQGFDLLTRLAKYDEVFIKTSKWLVGFNQPIMAFDFSPRPSSLALGLFVILVSIYVIRAIRYHATHKLPPGPRGIPFFGNLFQLSKTPWKEFEIWRKRYGKSTNHPSHSKPDFFPPQIP